MRIVGCVCGGQLALSAIVRTFGFHSLQSGELLELLIREIPQSDIELFSN